MHVETPGPVAGMFGIMASSTGVQECAEPENAVTTDVSTTSFTFLATAACHRADRLPVLLTAFDDRMETIAWALADDVPIVDGEAHVHFDAWHTETMPFTAHSTHVHHVDAGFSRTLRTIANGGEEFVAAVLPEAPPLADNTSFSGPVSALRFGPRWGYQEDDDDFPFIAGFGSRRVVRYGTGAFPPEVTTDHAAFIASIVGAPRDEQDPARFATSLELGAEGDTNYLAAIHFFDIEAATLEHWVVIAPRRDGHRVQLPALPDELVAFRPLGGPLERSIALFDASDLAYRDLVEASDWLITRTYERSSLPHHADERTTRMVEVQFRIGL